MPIIKQLETLRRSVPAWNAWRAQSSDFLPDLGGASLQKADLRGANLRRARLFRANMGGADLSEADLREASLRNANIAGATLYRANLTNADLRGANLRDATFTNACLQHARLGGAKLQRASFCGADLSDADLSDANLSGADLSQAILVRTNLKGANLSGCRVYGASTWDLQLDSATQTDLIISNHNAPTITVDNLEVAQFLYLILHNAKIRSVIDTLTSKVVLILGRFTTERKKVLIALCDELRARNYVPVLFDFEGSTNHTLTETITLLARMARFIIADLTEPSSIPKELEAIIPHIHVPVQPLIAAGATPYAMFADYRFYPWVLSVYQYPSLDGLLASIQEQVIGPAEAKVIDLRQLRQPYQDTGV